MEARFLWKGVHLVQASFIKAHDKVTWVPELEGVSPLVEEVIIGRGVTIGCHYAYPYTR